jgi:competence protein ComFC
MQSILSLLAQPTCVLCCQSTTEKDLCDTCNESLPTSLWTPAIQIENIDKVLVLGDYSETPGRLIRLAKYGKREDVARLVGSALAQALQDQNPNFDVVTPVPQSWPKSLWRGFSPVEIIAHTIGKSLKAPIHNTLGRRAGKSMAAAATRHRSQIAKSQFFVKTPPPRERILLIDDVLTTGTTASVCAGLLKSNGAKEVVLIAAASPLI